MTNTSTNKNPVPVKNSQLRFPSVLIYRGCGSGAGVTDYRTRWDPILVPDTSDSKRCLGMRHLGGTVILFADMHTKALSEQNTPSYKHGWSYLGPSFDPFPTKPRCPPFRFRS